MTPGIQKRRRFNSVESCEDHYDVCQSSRIAKDLVSQIRENDFKYLNMPRHKNSRKFFGQHMEVENMANNQKVQLVHFIFSTPPTFFDVDGVVMDPPKGFTAQWSYNKNEIVREYDAVVNINPSNAYATTYTEETYDDEIDPLLDEDEIEQIICNL